MITQYKTMGMTAVVNVVDSTARQEDVEKIFTYFSNIDNRFSTYKKTSEVEQINKHQILKKEYSAEMKKILRLSAKTKDETGGYFDVFANGIFDPSGIVKGYALYEASKMLKNCGCKNYYVEIGGDVDVRGKNPDGRKWTVGIKNPFKPSEIVKILSVSNKGVATSGNYAKGKHIYDPKKKQYADEIASITVIGPNIYEADRMATAAFAMGEKGIDFIEKLKNFEAYMIRRDKQAVATTGLNQYLNN